MSEYMTIAEITVMNSAVLSTPVRNELSSRPNRCGCLVSTCRNPPVASGFIPQVASPQLR